MAKFSPRQLDADDTPQQPATAVPPPQVIEIRIPADAEWVRVVRLAVAGVASRLRFYHDDIEDIKLAVTEACNNAILHAATPGDEAQGQSPLVIVQLSPYDDRLEISVADEGSFADGGLPRPALRLIPPHEHSAEQLLESGFGLFLMQSVMDGVEHYAGPDHNTTIRMVKYVREPSRAKRDA